MTVLQLLNGLALGVLLLVLASGLALIYGLRGVVNFAHGGLYMLGAYLAYSLSTATSFWVAIVAAPVSLAAIGVFLDRFGLRYLSHRSALELVLVTFGLTLVIHDVVHTFWGQQDRTAPVPSALEGSITVMTVTYPAYRLFVVTVGIAAAAALILWLRRSRIGLYVRASSTDREVTAMMGVNVDRVSAVVVGLGAGMAGLAGALAGPYLTLSPTMGNEILVTSFIVVVIGGIGSIGGAMAAALLLGMTQTLGAVYVPNLAALVPYVLMVAVLVWRPLGLVGSRT